MTGPTRIAAYCVVIDDARVLLAHWNQGSGRGWTMPGGGVEFGEHPAAAAVREALEETGFQVRLDRMLGVDSVVIPASRRLDRGGEPLHAVRLVWSAQVIGGTLQHEVGGSTDQAAWFPLDSLPRDRVGFVDTALGFWRASE